MSSPPQVALRWLDVLVIGLVLLIGLGSWSGAERVADAFYAERAPLEARYQREQGLVVRQVALKAAENELAASRAKLIEKEIEVVGLSAEEAATADLLTREARSNREGFEEQRKIALRLQATRNFVAALSAAMSEREQRVKERSFELAIASRTSATAFAQATRVFELKRKGLAILIGFGLMVGALALLCLVVTVAAKLVGLSPRWRLPLRVALPVLTLLVGYQAGELVGAAAVSLALLLWLGYQAKANNG
jgi:hypothetical protein